MKEKIKDWIRTYILDEHEEYAPKKFGEPRAVCFTAKYADQENICLCTEWPNGEGYDFVFGDNKFLNMHDDEINMMLACLNDLGYFE